MTETIRDGWHQVITAIPEALTTVAYRYESGGWWIPDPQFNEASFVGATISPLYTRAEVDELLSHRTEAGDGKPTTNEPAPSGSIEWGVQYGPLRSVQPFRNRGECERFIAYPPLWTTASHRYEPVIVTRLVAGDWRPAEHGPQDSISDV